MIRRHLVVLAAAAAWLPLDPAPLPAQGPPPAHKAVGPARSWSMTASAAALLNGNRVACGVRGDGQICGSTFSSTIGGGFWPAGTANSYVFNSGPQIAGIIGLDGGPWAGDTTGAFFYDNKGTTEHGVLVEGVYDSRNPEDTAAWPARARIPETGGMAEFFAPQLRGRLSVSEQDLWWVMTETDPALNNGRPHPLGVMVEVRAMAFGAPAGADDGIFLLYTFYNATSLDPADYLGAPPELQPLLLEQARLMHERAGTKFGVTLPAGGYTIQQVFAGNTIDADVAQAGSNYQGVNPALQYTWTWEHTFNPGFLPWWTFDPGMFESPFLTGPGLVAIGPVGASQGVTGFEYATDYIEHLYAINSTSLWLTLARRIIGDPSVYGLENCIYDVVATRACYVGNGVEDDVRGFVSSALPDLPPGGSVTLAVGYVFAPAVAVPGFAPAPGTDVKPGSLILPAVAGLVGGVPFSDSLAGYAGFEDVNGDGFVAPEEFLSVPGSLRHKFQIARAMFSGGFLRSSAPEAPDFFLIPGDSSVTIVWRPSLTETAGDPYADLAEQPRLPSGTVNPLYDPNFRRMDVEGYRIWRARVDDPAQLELVAQFDYGNTRFRDHDGLVLQGFSADPETCAPELGAMDGCPVAYDPMVPGQVRTVAAESPISGGLVQVRVDGQRPQRIRLSSGRVLVLRADTLVTGGESGLPDLQDTGVPFQFTDSTVRNGLRYYYAVTAFDVNSIRSGPSSQESPRILRSVTPRRPATNYVLEGLELGVTLLGRGVALDTAAPMPTLDPVQGTFTGPAAPANGWSFTFVDFDPGLFTGSGSATIRLDSVVLGSPYPAVPGPGTQSVPHLYWYSALATGTTFVVPILQQQEFGVRSGSTAAGVMPVDPDLAAGYGGGTGYALQGVAQQSMDGADYTSLYGRGCVNGRPGFTTLGVFGACEFNGSRWFDGPSPMREETFGHPNGGNQPNFSNLPMTTPSNAGRLTGVVTIHNSQSYQQLGGASYRGTEGIKSGAKRAADFNIYWGAGGRIDSVIDVTHNVPLAFDSAKAGGGWGILNASETPPGAPGNQSADQRPELTNLDMGCVEPFRSYRVSVDNLCGTAGIAPQYILGRTAIPGPVVTPLDPGVTAYRTAAPQPNNGFVLYVSGDFMTFELQAGAVPSAGIVWTLRQYIGAISGGRNSTGSVDHGDYVFSPSPWRTLSAVGVELRLDFEVTNGVRGLVSDDVQRAHPVPDPYYALQAVSLPPEQQGIAFMNLPAEAVVRIYSASGRLVRVLEHASGDNGGTVRWDVRNRAGDPVASGVYFYHVESGDARKAGRMTIVNTVGQ